MRRHRYRFGVALAKSGHEGCARRYAGARGMVCYGRVRPPGHQQAVQGALPPAPLCCTHKQEGDANEPSTAAGAGRIACGVDGVGVDGADADRRCRRVWPTSCPRHCCHRAGSVNRGSLCVLCRAAWPATMSAMRTTRSRGQQRASGKAGLRGAGQSPRRGGRTALAVCRVAGVIERRCAECASEASEAASASEPCQLASWHRAAPGAKAAARQQRNRNARPPCEGGEGAHAGPGGDVDNRADRPAQQNKKVARRYKLTRLTWSPFGSGYPALERARAIWWACGPCLATRSASRHWAAVMPHCTAVRIYSARRPDHE